MKPIYLDYNASTPIAPEVAAAMQPLLAQGYGNPSSPHWAGRPAKALLEEARVEVGTALGCAPEEVVFTSGGSEANNAALKGVFFAARRRVASPHVITTAIEHPAIEAPCVFLESLGARVTRLPVDGTGLVDPAQVRAAITPDTVLVSVMHANNEVGTVEPLAEISVITRERGVLLHTDAAQSVGKIRTDVEALGVDLLSVAGHKLYAPKGVGALYIRKGVELEPFVHGAGHEAGRRAGTESVLLAVGLGRACRLAVDTPCTDHLASVTQHLWRQLQAACDGRLVRHGHPDRCLPNTLSVSLPGTLGQEVLHRLEGVAASTGSACHSGTPTLSPVLDAMGVTPEVGLGAIRFSVGRSTTMDEVDEVVDRLRRVVSGAASTARGT